MNEANGKWGSAQHVAGTVTGSDNADAGIFSVSCASAGACGAGGDNNGEAIVVDESGGDWGAAQAVPGTSALNTGGSASVASVSCASAGNCSAGGYYSSSEISSSYRLQEFVPAAPRPQPAGCPAGTTLRSDEKAV